MAQCKICGQPVVSGLVLHDDCLERQITDVAAQFCDDYCVWPDMYTSQELLEQERCDRCPVQQLMQLIKR